jgi:4-oxalocrotonate tautomerase
MPILNVKVAAVASRELTQAIVDGLSELTSRVLRKDPDVTAIVVEYVDPEHWYAGGRALAAQGKSSFYFDVRVVDETNTKAEKAAYIREAFFAALLGNVHAESYIHVLDVRAAAYGYGGLTQEERAYCGGCP